MTADRTPLINAQKVDELLRNALRVGDPRNAGEVAAALRARYVGESLRLAQEAQGFAVAPQSYGTATAPAPTAGPGTTTQVQVEGAADRALRWVRDSITADLADLIDDPANREWQSELIGWRDTLLRELEEGAAAARYAPDSAQRDRTALAVRRLNDYAWLSRLVSALNFESAYDYRRLAKSLDRGADVLRVLLGAGLFQAGFADGGVIVRISQADLMQRRDRVLRGLRIFIGMEGDDDWGDGPAAYRVLEKALDDASAPDLKVFLREDQLAATLERLIQDAFRGSGASNQAFPATSPTRFDQIELRRFVEIASDQLSNSVPVVDNHGKVIDQPQQPVSSGLSNFVQSLGLFLAAFDEDRAGARYIDLATPVPIAAWEVDEDDGPVRSTLRELVSQRALLANGVEAALQSGNLEEADGPRYVIALDRLLFDIDRCVDLLALGSGPEPGAWGDQELRARAHGYAVLALCLIATSGDPFDAQVPPIVLTDPSTLPTFDPVALRATLNTQVGIGIADPLAQISKLLALVLKDDDVARFLKIHAQLGREQLALRAQFTRIAKQMALQSSSDVALDQALGALFGTAAWQAGAPATRAFPPHRRISSQEQAVYTGVLANLASLAADKAGLFNGSGNPPKGGPGPATSSPGGGGAGGGAVPTGTTTPPPSIVQQGHGLLQRFRQAVNDAGNLKVYKESVKRLDRDVKTFNKNLRSSLESSGHYRSGDVGQVLHDSISDAFGQAMSPPEDNWNDARQEVISDLERAEVPLNKLAQLFEVTT